MFTEMYTVEEVDGRKVIQYNGFVWWRKGDLRPCAVIEGSFCFVEIGEDNYKRVYEEFERVHQYQYEHDRAWSYERNWKQAGHYLPMNYVTQDTPCGMYWFEIYED